MKLVTGAFLLASVTLSRLGGASLPIQTADVTVASDRTFSLDTDAADVSHVYAFQLDIDFTPGLHSTSKITEGDFLARGQDDVIALTHPAFVTRQLPIIVTNISILHPVAWLSAREQSYEKKYYFMGAT